MSETLPVLFYMAIYTLSLPAYAVAHEVIHFLAARVHGCQARIGLVKTAPIPSMGVKVYCSYWDRSTILQILYLPYILNVLLILASFAASIEPYSRIMRAIALSTLPNMLLESEKLRNTQLNLYVLLASTALLVAAWL